MNKSIIELGGDFQGVDCTAYFESKYFTDGRLDTGKVNHYGFDCAVKCDLYWENAILKLSEAPKSDDRNFIFICIRNPLIMFDINKIKSNVEIEVIRSHSTIQWCIYGAALLFSKIKSKLTE